MIVALSEGRPSFLHSSKSPRANVASPLPNNGDLDFAGVCFVMRAFVIRADNQIVLRLVSPQF